MCALIGACALIRTNAVICFQPIIILSHGTLKVGALKINQKYQVGIFFSSVIHVL